MFVRRPNPRLCRDGCPHPPGKGLASRSLDELRSSARTRASGPAHDFV